MITKDGWYYDNAIKRGDGSGLSRLTLEQVRIIRWLHVNYGYNERACAYVIGYNYARTVAHVIHWETWKHVVAPASDWKPPQWVYGKMKEIEAQRDYNIYTVVIYDKYNHKSTDDVDNGNVLRQPFRNCVAGLPARRIDRRSPDYNTDNVYRIQFCFPIGGRKIRKTEIGGVLSRSQCAETKPKEIVVVEHGEKLTEPDW